MNFCVKNLSSKIEEKPFLKNINFSITKPGILLILGNNGQGKTTLLKTLMHHFSTQIISGEISLNNEQITNLNTYELSKKGILYIPQNSVEFNSIQTLSFLKNINDNNHKIPFSSLYTKIKEFLKKYSLSEELLTRNLNEGFSGGQKKKMELLQASIINPDILLIDEIDSGVDYESIKKIAKYINEVKKEKIIILISHNANFLKLIKPENVVIIEEGKIIKKGKYSLINEFQKSGINKFVKSRKKVVDSVCYLNKKK
ncbi:MAG: ATP-binding cassette domain-containing protein [Mycoplasmataceae bacterium]|jgi:Fe-S cluster assembly ATP-binding protein|nr:ATP-binding cassette domain-containing protein [Mycoplasmataceae bacterium]